MKINVIGHGIKEVKYRTWTEGSGYGPDCSQDILGQGLLSYDDDWNVIMDEEEYFSAVDYLKDCAREQNEQYEEDGKAELYEDFVHYDYLYVDEFDEEG